MDEAKVIQVIETTLTRRGEGVEGDPIRIIRQYWSLDGALLGEVDLVPPKQTISMEAFRKINQG